MIPDTKEMTAARSETDAAIATWLYVSISKTGYNSLVFRNTEALCSMIRKKTKKRQTARQKPVPCTSHTAEDDL